MKLFAKAIFDEYDSAIYSAECNQKGFNSLFEKGQELLENNPNVNYEIGVFTDNFRLFWSINPFPLKVVKNFLSENFEGFVQEELKSFLSDDFQNDKEEMAFARKKQYEWDKIPDFVNMKQKEIEIWGRLGISLSVTQNDLEILRGDDREKANELLIELIQSDKCKIYGDTYFPELIYNNYLDLDFDLSEAPLHKDVGRNLDQSVEEHNSLNARINKAKYRTEEKGMIQNDKELSK